MSAREVVGRPDGAAEGSAGPRVLLYGRAGCHLCDDARAVVVEVCEALGESWAEVDVETDPALVERYGEYVPVVTVDGVQQAFWRVDPARLRRALGAAR